MVVVVVVVARLGVSAIIGMFGFIFVCNSIFISRLSTIWIRK